jgi:23S rRNA (cytidine1920-2'-O)/16S rRNA (cytidine1409-2'-O)-methyltransferase
MMAKIRLDVLLVERGLVESRSLAQRIIMAGQVRVNGQVVLKAATAISSDADVTLDRGPQYVSRGGEKLAAALGAFHIDVDQRVCADVGASTGGFTDCLLQNNAKRVYAIDVGQGILHWNLRQDERVVVMEGTNARYLEFLPEPVSLITIDASFISLRVLLPVVIGWMDQTAELVLLVKPQFEAGRAEAARGDGVIRDPAVHRRVLEEVLEFSRSKGLCVSGLIRSPLTGPKGNVEFLTWLTYPTRQTADYQAMIDSIISSIEY